MQKLSFSIKLERCVEKVQDWFVYIIVNRQNKLYTGITTDILRRWNEHLTGHKGAKFFRISPPSEILFVNSCKSRSEASILEAKIKKMKRAEKLLLVDSLENQIEDYKLNTVS